MKFREHRGTLADSMETVRELADRAALDEYLIKLFKPWMDVTPAMIEAKPFSQDMRIGWDTWAILVDDTIVGFTDGNPDEVVKGED